MRGKTLTKGSVATTVTGDAAGWTNVTYHGTHVVRFNADTVILNSGGFRTPTTLKRMNQAATQFRLPFHVRQKDGAWSVWLVLQDQAVPFTDNMTISRKA